MVADNNDYMDELVAATIAHFFNPYKEADKSNNNDLDQLASTIRQAADIKERQIAVAALRKIKDAKALELAIEALEDEAVGVRAVAVDVLGQMRKKQAVAPLCKLLEENENDWDMRYSIVNSLGRIRAKAAVSHLAKALTDKDRYIREAAGYALGKIGTQEILPILIEALKDEHHTVWEAAYKGIRKFREKAVVPLIAALKAEHPQIRSHAAGLLSTLHTEQAQQAVEPLIQALKDSDPEVRDSAAWSLNNLEDKRAVKPLIEALHDPDKSVRRRLLHALYGFADELDEQLLPDLEALQQDEDRSVGEAAGRVINKIKHPDQDDS